MLLIYDVKVMKVDRDEVEFHCLTNTFPLYKPLTDGNEVCIPPDALRELVRGYRLRRSTGEDVCIGATKDVQKALSMTFETFDSHKSEMFLLGRDLRDKTGELTVALAELNTIKNATWWSRIKWVIFNNIDSLRNG